MEKKLIIFDCFGTLLTKSNGKSYQKFLEENEISVTNEYIMTNKNINWNDFVDFDKITEQSFNSSLDELNKNIKDDISNIFPCFEGLTDCLDLLKQKYVVVILSNLAQDYFNPIEKLLSNHVDNIFLSYEIGFVKPNPESFQTVKNWYEENYCQIEDKNIMVIDDSHKNIRYISNTEMTGIHISNGNIDSPNSIKSFFNWILQ